MSQKKKIITSAISQIFHIDTPRDWQIEAIHHVLFRRAPLTIISRRTADGKSLVPLCVGAVGMGGSNSILAVAECINNDTIYLFKLIIDVYDPWRSVCYLILVVFV